MALSPIDMIKKVHHKVRLLRWEYITLGIIALALIGLTIWGLQVSNAVQQPQKVSDAFLHYARTNDIDEAQKLTSEPFRQSNELSVIAKDIQLRIKKDPQVNEYRITRTEEGSYVATVEYRISEQNDMPLIVKLIKENDNWRILTINDLR